MANTIFRIKKFSCVVHDRRKPSPHCSSVPDVLIGDRPKFRLIKLLLEVACKSSCNTLNFFVCP
jgi:hypothetical protein